MNSKPSGKRPHRAENSQEPMWCGVCHIRVAPYEMAIRVMGNIYHSHCLDHLRHGRRRLIKRD